MITYANNWFVNRTSEISQVQKKVDWLLENRLVEKRTVIFTGEHGIGKTWLLRHLYERFNTQHGLKSYYLDLSQLPTSLLPPENLHYICQRLTSELLKEDGLPDLSPEAEARYLIQEIKVRILGKHPLVFLIDSVYESAPALLAMLESYLLAPLAVQPKVLLLIAGRGQPYPWREAELRLRAEFITLEAFTNDYTREQLQRQLPATLAKADETFALSFGNPKANWWLASHQNQAQSLSQIIDEMLTPIDVGDRPQVRVYLEAVAIPRMFDESTIPILLHAYTNDPQWQKPSRSKVRQICDALLRPGLIFWNTEVGGYTLYPSTRNLILRFLCAIDLTRWVKLHTAMLNLYESWLRDDPPNRHLWQAEVNYHQEAIQRQCP